MIILERMLRQVYKEQGIDTLLATINDTVPTGYVVCISSDFVRVYRSAKHAGLSGDDLISFVESENITIDDLDYYIVKQQATTSYPI